MPKGVYDRRLARRPECENCGVPSIKRLCFRCTAIEEKEPVFDRGHAHKRGSEFGELDFNRE